MVTKLNILFRKLNNHSVVSNLLNVICTTVGQIQKIFTNICKADKIAGKKTKKYGCLMAETICTFPDAVNRLPYRSFLKVVTLSLSLLNSYCDIILQLLTT